MALLKATNKYLNKYEVAYDRFSTTSPFFNESDWRKFTLSNNPQELDMYVTALSKTTGLDKSVFDKEYLTEGQDDETRILALYNEAYGDRDTMMDVQEYVYDDAGNVILDANGKPKTTTVQMSKYDYTKKVIYERNKGELDAVLAEAKEEANGNIFADVAAVGGEVLSGADVALKATSELVITFMDTFGDFVNALFGSTVRRAGPFGYAYGSTDYWQGWENAFYNWNYYYDDPSKGLIFNQIPTEIKDGEVTKTLRDSLTEFEINYTHFRDENGNLTTAGRWFVGMANTAGEMLAASFIGAGVGQFLGQFTYLGQLSSNIQSIVNQTTYYAPIAARSMDETFNELTAADPSISASSILANQLVKTAAEIAIEVALGKILGPTGLDKWLFGKAGKASPKAKNFAQILGGHALDMVQEGTEEVLQEFSGIALDNLFGLFADDNFAELSECSWQTIGDAFVIGALVSGGYSAVSTTLGVATTPATKILDENGNVVERRGKIANYVRGYNMQSFIEFYQESLGKIEQALNEHSKLLPSESRLAELNAEKVKLVKQLAALHKEATTGDIAKSVTGKVSPSRPEGFNTSALRATLQSMGYSTDNVTDEQIETAYGEAENKTITEKLSEIESEINEVKEALANEKVDSGLNDAENARTIELRNQYIEAFQGMYAAMRMLQSFETRLGKDRLAEADGLLTKLTDYLNSGKWETSKIRKLQNDFINTLQLSGIEVTSTLRERIEHSKIAKLLHVFSKKDKKTDEVETEDVTPNLTKEQRQRMREQAQEILNGSKTIENVVISEDGRSVAADEKTLIIPEKILKLGNVAVFNDLAEQALVQNILNGTYKGPVIEDILLSYREISGNGTANEYDAIYHLLFDSAFFKTMLSGNMHLKTGKVSLADTDMYQFLTSLYNAYESFVPVDLQTTTYKNKMNTVRKAMGSALVSYLKMQPYADYRLDFLTDSQKTEIRQHTEAMSVANRLVIGQGTKNDLAFIKRKINALAISAERKTMLTNMVTGTNRTDIAKALSVIDEQYRISFYGSYDGKTYLPLNSVKNRVFNHFLYENKITLRNIAKLMPNGTVDQLVADLSQKLSSRTNSRYELQVVSNDLLDPASGIFSIGQLTVAIVDKESPLGAGLFVNVPLVKDKTIITRTGKQTALMKKVLKTANYGYYTIDDAITNPDILTDEIREKIKKAYGTINPESTYLYLKDFFTSNGVTLSVYADGQVGFVDVTKVEDFMVKKIAKTKVVNGAIVSQFVKDPDTIPFLGNCRIELTSGDSHFEVSTDRGITEGIIYVNRDVKNDPEKLKTTLAHEIQHAIQYSNKLNTGNDGSLLEKLTPDDQKKLVKELQEKLPGEFGKLKGENLINRINQFLYYGSGEVDAFGATSAEVAKFYPVLIQDNPNGTVDITLPWGSKYRTELSARSKAQVDDFDSKTDTIKRKLASLDYRVSGPIFLTSNGVLGNVNELTMELKDDQVRWLTPKNEMVAGASLATTDRYYRDVITGRMSIGFKTFDDIKSLFYEFVEADEIRLLGDRVFAKLENSINSATGEKLHFYIIPNFSKKSVGLYDPNTHEIYYSWTHMAKLLKIGSREHIAEMLVHECIHAVTSAALYNVEGRLSSTDLELYLRTGIMPPAYYLLNDAEKAALSLIAIYRQLSAEKSTVELYGHKDVHEMVAELSNPDFRDFLKKRTLWDKIISLIRRILGIDEPNMLASAEKALDAILNADYEILEENTYAPTMKQIHGKEVETTKVDKNVHVRSKGRTPRKRVPKKKSKGTLLEPFGGKRLGLPLQDFITKSGLEKYQGIRHDIRKKIEDGTLTNHDLMVFLYNATPGNEADERTFELLNETIFHNENFESLEDLDNTILTKTAYYYAIRVIFRSLGMIEALESVNNPELFNKYVELIDTDDTYKEYRNIVKRYWSGAIISEKNLRRLWLQYFDGSVASGGYIAGVAKVVAYQALKEGWVVTAEQIDPPTEDDFKDANGFVYTVDTIELIKSAIQTSFGKELRARLERGETIDYVAEAIRMDDELNKLGFAEIALKDGDSSALKELYDQYIGNSQQADYGAVLTSITADVVASNEEERFKILGETQTIRVPNKQDIMRAIRYRVKYIVNHLSPLQLKKFIKENNDIFNENGKLKDEVYSDLVTSKNSVNGVVRLKDESVLIELKERIVRLANDVKLGFYSSKQATKYRQEMERKVNSIIKALTKEGAKEAKAARFTILSDEVYVNTDLEIPVVVKRLLETALTKTARSTTQVFTNETDRHFVMNYKTFLEQNAETLNALTQAEVDEIVEFYTNSEILPESNHAKIYMTVQQLLMAHIYKMSTRPSSNFVLTNDQASKIEKRFEVMVSTAATIVATWKNALKEIKPEEVFTKALLKAAGVELGAVDEANLIEAIKSGDVERITAARHAAYNNLARRYRGRKRTLIDRLLKYERLAMLTGPGTMVRNWTSNTLLTVGNDVSEWLVKLFPRSGKAEKLEQYQIIGTKIDAKYATWIKEVVIDGGLLALISDGLTKYDARKANKMSLENHLAKLIADKIGSDLYANDNWFTKIVLKMMSDERWVNKAFIKYLGKMMTEDQIDISKGLTNDILEVIAEAYTMAAQDYMHTSNIISKLERFGKDALYTRWGLGVSDGVYFMYKQLFPFAAASWNWFMEGLNYTPVGLAKGIIQFCRLEKTVTRMEDARRVGEKIRSPRFAEYLARRKIGKGIIGSIGWIAGMLLAAFGRVQFDDDDDKYKIKVGDGKSAVLVDVSDLFGTSGMLWGMAMVQGFRDIDGNLNFDKFCSAMAGTLNIMFLDSTLSDLFSVIRSGESIGNYIVNMPFEIVGSFIPNLVKTFTRISKKYKTTYSPGFLGKLENIVNQLPGVSYFLPYNINPYTGNAQPINNVWWLLNSVNSLTPIKFESPAIGDIEYEAISLGVRKTQLTGKYEIDGNAVTLSSTDRERLNEFYGKLNAKDLKALMDNKTKYTVEDTKGNRVEIRYKDMTDEQKKTVIERIMSNNGQLAKVYILTADGGYKYYASNAEYERLKKAGITKNVYRKTGKYEGFVKN